MNWLRVSLLLEYFEQVEISSLNYSDTSVLFCLCLVCHMPAAVLGSLLDSHLTLTSLIRREAHG